MSKSSLNACRVGAIALLAAVGIASTSGGQRAGYLTKIGPGPLRFLAARPAVQIANLPPLAMDDEDVATAKIPSAPTTAGDVTYRAQSPFAMMSLPLKFFTPSSLWISGHSQPEAENTPPPEIAAPATSEASNPPASDLLTVTPQMLVDYFKPQAQTNANASALAPVSFTPATISGGAEKAP